MCVSYCHISKMSSCTDEVGGVALAECYRKIGIINK